MENEIKFYSAERIRDALDSARDQLLGRGTDMRTGFLVASHAIEALLQEKPDDAQTVVTTTAPASAAELAGYVREMLSDMIIEVHVYQEKEVKE